MLKFPVPFKTTIFVCTHKRPDGHPKPCCADRGGRELREGLREMVMAEGRDAEVRVFQSGCLGGCEQGPVAVQFPTGEMMLGIAKDDLPAILDDAVKG